MRYFLLCLPLLVPLPANAEMLLLEIGWENQPQALPAFYGFSVGNSGVPGVSWREQVTSYPYESIAPPETVEQFNLHLGWFPWIPTLEKLFPIVGIGIFDKPANEVGVVLQRPELPALCISCYWSRLVANEGDSGRTGLEWAAFAESVGWNVDLRVPLLGQGLRGYEITSMQRIVTDDAQTIRIFGTVVPEPASWLLVLCYCAAHFSRRRPPVE